MGDTNEQRSAVHTIEVAHSIDAGHRVVGHTAPDGSPGKCARLHGHTYAIVVELHSAALNEIGFVVDFGVIKDILNEWDHRLLLWDEDPVGLWVSPERTTQTAESLAEQFGVIRLPFNPTAENMSKCLAEKIVAASDALSCTVIVSETPKTRATFTANAASEAATFIEPDQAAVEWPTRGGVLR